MKLLTLTCVALLILSMSGCSDENNSTSDSPLSQVTTPFVSTTMPETTTTITTTTPTATTTATPVIAPPKGSVPAGFDPKLFVRNPAFESNIAFIGDSICSGFKVYPHLLLANQVFADRNIRTDTIFNYTFTYNNGKYSIVDCIKVSKPKNVYIWMGLNGINFTSKEAYAKNMVNLVQKLKAVSPQTKFFIMSMTPTTASHSWHANGKIKECNVYTENLLKANYPDIGFVNIYNILADKNGNLLSVFAAADGCHIKPITYTRILSYMAYGK